MNHQSARTREIVRVGRTAILVSVVLALLEALEGVFSGSVSMILDGLSHITEASNAVITVLGVRLAGKPADRKHPFGYGRVEYLSGLLIAGLTAYAGITGILGGIQSALHPSRPHFTVYSFSIIIISMIARIVVGRHDVHTGQHMDSRALTQTGKSELKHSLLSLVTIAGMLVYTVFHVSIESWLAIAISADILFGGLIMVRDMLSSMLGERMEEELAQDVERTILEEEQVLGAYDMSLNNYGPGRHTGSVHIAIPDTLSVVELDKITRRITRCVYEKHGVFLTGIGIYTENTKDPEIIRIRKEISALALAHPYVEQVHGFYLDPEEKKIRFDTVVGFDAPDRMQVRDAIQSEAAAKYPAYSIQVSLDTDFGMLHAPQPK